MIAITYCFFTRSRNNKHVVSATTVTVPATQQGDNSIAAEPVQDRYQKNPPFRKGNFGLQTTLQADNVHSTPLTSTESHYEPVVPKSAPLRNPSPSLSPVPEEAVYESGEFNGSSYMPMKPKDLSFSVPAANPYDTPRSEPCIKQVGEAVHYVASGDCRSSDTGN